ncbi:MAG TPA: hypothetical protein VFE91_06015 [Nitrososphaerales archaeon]|nr:hypothetical protein [Nitrososphaerales archaeon]
MPLDDLARRMLKELNEESQSAEALATRCASGAIRMISPRLVWLEGLGLIENSGTGSFGITEVGKKFLEAIA